MMTIWKFPIPMQDEFSIMLPKGAEILFVAAQYEIACIWARVDAAADMELRGFSLRGTGHPIEPDRKHIGSFMLGGGTLVFHLFQAW